MIIKKLIIYGYGKWIDTEFDVNAPFHLFYGGNEAGKSTLMSFIHSIFFGFPTRHSSASRYEPKESSRYGGKIIIQDKRYGEVSIERVLGKVTGDVTVQLEDGTTGDDALLTTLFYGKSRTFFESIYSFNLKGIEDIQELNKDQLNRYFLSIGALGHEKYLKKADQYHSQASKLFKPMGRKPEINQLQLKLKEKRRVVEKAKEKNDSYINLVKSHLAQKDQLKAVETDLSETVDELGYLNELSKYQETIQEIETVKKRLQDLPELNLPEEGLFQLKQYGSEIETYQKKIDALQEKQKGLQYQYKPSKELVLYHQNEEDLSAFEKELDIWEDKAQELQLIKKDTSNIRQSITEIRIREDIAFSDAIPLEPDKEDIKYLNDIRSRLAEIQDEAAELEEESRKIEYRISINNDLIDKIEPQLIPLAEYSNLSDEAESSNVLESEKRTKIPYGIAAAAAGLVSIFLFMENILYGIGFSTVFVILLYFMMNTQGQDAKKMTEEQRNLLYEQKNLRTQWKELLAANDDFQSKKEEIIKKLNKLNTERRSVDTRLEQWKHSHDIPGKVSIHSLEDKLSIYRRLREWKAKESEAVNRQEALEAELTERSEAFERLFKRSFIANDVVEKFKEMKSIFRDIKNEQREMQEYIKKTEEIQHEINYYVQKVSELKKAKHQFFDSLNVADKEEVYDLYAAQKEKEENESRLAVLLEKLPVKDEGDLKSRLQDLNISIKEIEEKQQTLRGAQKALLKEMMEIEMQIRHLEDGGIYTELLQEFENEKSYYQEVVDKWAALKTAAGMIEKTLHYAKEDKLPQTLAVAGSYFSFLTDNKYEKLLFDDEVLSVMDSKGKKWPSDDLSRGTVEPLYISLRLAFIKITKDSIEFPVLIDDPFVNLDDTRVRKMYDLLTGFDEDIQLIYFSFDRRIHSFIEEKNCVYLTNQQ